MSGDATTSLVILCAAIVLITFELVAIDLVAILMIIAVVATGILTPAEAFSGFSSDVVITLAAVFVIAGTVSRAGLAETMAQAILKVGKDDDRVGLATVMGLSAALSTVFSNTSTTTVLTPGVMTYAKRSGVGASRLLMPLAFASMMTFSTWMAVASNFVIEVVDFDGSDQGWMHTVREIPGFLAFLAVFIFILIREQTFGILSLLTLGLGSAITAEFPTLQGVLVVTFISSLGFHYYETVAQSLQLQWLPKAKAPKMLGWIASAGAFGALTAYGGIVMTWETLGLDYRHVYWASGGVTAALAIFCWFAYPQFRSPTAQRHEIVLKKRYWLYYALVFMGGARRQIRVDAGEPVTVGRDCPQLRSVFVHRVKIDAIQVVPRLFGRYREIRLFEQAA